MLTPNSDFVLPVPHLCDLPSPPALPSSLRVPAARLSPRLRPPPRANLLPIPARFYHLSAPGSARCHLRPARPGLVLSRSPSQRRTTAPQPTPQPWPAAPWPAPPVARLPTVARLRPVASPPWPHPVAPPPPVARLPPWPYSPVAWQPRGPAPPGSGSPVVRTPVARHPLFGL